MSLSVEIAWWVSLILVGVLTLVAWTLLNRLVMKSKMIESYGLRTLPAAVNIVQHTESIKLFETTKSVAGEIIATAKGIDEVVADIEKKIGA